MQVEFTHKYFTSMGDWDNLPGKEETKKSLAKYRLHLVSFIEKLPQDAKVLDVGCGSGKAMKLVKILRPDIKIYGTDIMDMKDFLPESIPFKQGSVENLSEMYEKDFFDAVISLHVIEHLLYPTAMISEIKKVLKKGGVMFIETPNWVRAIMPHSYIFFWNDYTHVRLFSKTTMFRLMEEFELLILKNITTNSNTWLVKKQITSSGGGKKKFLNKLENPLVKRIINRLINPFFRDVLIVEAKKQ